MERIRTIAMHTDHSYHGSPIETSAVTLSVDESVTPEQVEFLKTKQEERLRSLAKRMPHRYWAPTRSQG